MLKSGAAYMAKGTAYEAQAGEYLSLLGSSGSVHQGEANIAFTTSGMKGAVWLQGQAVLSFKAGAQCELQAAAHTTASVSTPQLPDIARNHVTHAVLEATNFLGINGVPIAENETDYLVRMWNQAGDTMAGYESETMANVAGLANIVPAQPMAVGPGASAEALANSGFLAAAGLPAAVGRDAIMTGVGIESTLELGAQSGGRLAATAEEAQRKAQAMSYAAGLAGQQGGTQGAEDSAGGGQQLMSQAMPMATQTLQQGTSQITELPSKAMQGPQSMAQQLMGPLQQMMSGSGGSFGTDSTGTPVDQVGLLGASPFSNHPLAGGSGAGGGAGMLSGSAIPGAGGTAIRTPYMASLTTASATNGAAVGEVAPTTAATRAGMAPVGGMPVGAAGHRGENGKSSSIEGTVAPQALIFDGAVDNIDDWDA
ncbi:putative PPE family immunogenic protein PPE68 [Mycobacteroides salmoniphilum]|uniref:Putative PPE family immunogenic protein PPE68 n=2 Tax=Mycobacteroides salmoniphilum TaxID=404941 RepID=A0A4R8SZS4_9MYCO|nr:putative PPE family immunogenic protein PPE68 [Mycobacteroides salmoniphilum]